MGLPLSVAAPASDSFAQAAVVTALTDNGGGTADGTVASQAAPTTITDSTGLSGTHDDTLAATTVPTTLTDSTGLSGSHNDTLEAVTTFTPSVAWDGATETLPWWQPMTQHNARQMVRMGVSIDGEVPTTLASILTALKNAGIMASA